MDISLKQARILTGFIVVALMIIFYHPILFSPNSYMFCNGEDGLANYFTFAYHLQSNGEIINCSAMNYPFGESVFYIDMMPGVVTLVALLKPIFPDIALYSVGLVNYLIFISWLFAALLLFEIYRFYRISLLGAVLASVSVIFLSPQIDRIFYGHYALGLIVFIPWIVWLCLRFFEKKRRIAGFTIFFLNLWILCIHAYLGIITTFITLVFAVFYIEKNHILKSLTKILIPVLPLFIYFFINKLFDHHSMREIHTWGYFWFNSNIYSFFIPRNGFLNEHFISSLKPSPEGDAYIGIFACIAILLLVFYFLKETIVKKTLLKTDSLLDEKSLKIILFTGILGGLIAMSFPFWFGLQKYFDIMPFIKQFRSIGRFSWIFYYCISILAPVIIYNFLQKTFVKKQTALIVFYVLLLIPISEAVLKQMKVRERYTLDSNWLNEKNLSDEDKLLLENIEEDRYQAIIPLPYFHNGSNCYFKLEDTDNIIRLNYIVSFYKKMSSFGVRLSRTSLLDSRIIGSLFLPPYCERAIANHIDSEKPLLVIADKTKPLLFYEEGLMEQATLFYENDNVALYNLSPTALKHIDKDYFTSQLAPVHPIYYESFSDHDKGILSLPPWNTYPVFDSRNVDLEPDSLYRLSFWTYIGEDDRSFKNDVIFSYFDENGELLEKNYSKTGYGMLLYNDWGRIDHLFSISGSQYLVVEVMCIGTQNYFDDVMLQKKSENTVIENDNNEVLYNNFKINRL